MLYVAVSSEADKPWLLGIQHCRQAQVYDAEVPLLSAIAARIGDGLQTWERSRRCARARSASASWSSTRPRRIVILDMTTGKFVEVNSKAMELFGMSREQLLQVGPVELSPPTQPDGSRSADAAGPRLGGGAGRRKPGVRVAAPPTRRAS